MKVYKIYKLINLITNMSYIGQTCKSVKHRINRHIVNDTYIGRAIRKYELENFKIEVLWKTISKETADCIEKVAIDFYNCIAPNSYNLTAGGEGIEDYKHTEEWKKENGERKKGYKHSKEFCNSQSKFMKGNQFAKGKNLGNQNAKGKHWTLSKETIEKKKGNQYAKGKHPSVKGNKNPMNRTDVKIKRLKTCIKKLDIELAELCPWDGT